MSKLLLSCDWGTSSFRLRLIAIDTHQILAEILSADGISATHTAWEKHSEKQRLSKSDFYNQQLLQQINKLSVHAHTDIKNIPLIISGMASSTLGLSELPYAQLPFNVDGSSLIIEVFEFNDKFPHDIYLISGIRSDLDVMRGEETQLVGIIEFLKIEHPKLSKESTLIFPGTHSKHIYIENGNIIGFNTCITGELFELTSNKSILKESVKMPSSDYELDAKDLEAFCKGVKLSETSGLLSTLFSVRANWLFQVFNKYQNYYYLSGLIIGAELNEMKGLHKQDVVLCSGTHLHEFYKMALAQLGISTTLIAADIMDIAVVKGQIKIFLDINLRNPLFKKI